MLSASKKFLHKKYIERRLLKSFINIKIKIKKHIINKKNKRKMIKEINKITEW